MILQLFETKRSGKSLMTVLMSCPTSRTRLGVRESLYPCTVMEYIVKYCPIVWRDRIHNKVFRMIELREFLTTNSRDNILQTEKNGLVRTMMFVKSLKVYKVAKENIVPNIANLNEILNTSLRYLMQTRIFLAAIPTEYYI